MRKLLIFIICVCLMLCVTTVIPQQTYAINYQWFDTTYSFDSAIVRLPNGNIVEGEVESWRDYENSDQIQIKIDGVTYLVHSNNVVLIAE